MIVVELVLKLEVEFAADAAGDFLDYLPVGPAVSDGVYRLADALDAALAVGEGAVLFGERGGGQDDVGYLGGLVHEDVLHDEKFELLERLLGVVEVGLAEERVLPGDVHRLHAAFVYGRHHVGDDQTGIGRERLAAPGRLELGQGLFSDGLVAGEGVGQAAGVAAALHVVLAPERGDAGAGRPS